MFLALFTVWVKPRDAELVVLPLTEGRRLLLLKTFAYTPTAELKEQLKNYAIKLKEGKNSLPHVVFSKDMISGKETVLIMNEENLEAENNERLLHWRLGNTSSKVLQAMDLIQSLTWTKTATAAINPNLSVRLSRRTKGTSSSLNLIGDCILMGLEDKNL